MFFCLLLFFYFGGWSRRGGSRLTQLKKILKILMKNVSVDLSVWSFLPNLGLCLQLD